MNLGIKTKTQLAEEFQNRPEQQEKACDCGSCSCMVDAYEVGYKFGYETAKWVLGFEKLKDEIKDK